jgi:hypothetical protein
MARLLRSGLRAPRLEAPVLLRGGGGGGGGMLLPMHKHNDSAAILIFNTLKLGTGLSRASDGRGNGVQPGQITEKNNTETISLPSDLEYQR